MRNYATINNTTPLKVTNTLIMAIFFDFYNTIGKFDPSREQLQMVACRSFGINVTQQGIIKGYANADSYMAKQVSVRPLRDMNPEEFDDFFAEYQSLILKGSGFTVDKNIALKIASKLRSLPKGFSLFEDVLPVLAELKQSGLKLGLLSNNEGDIDELSNRLGLHCLMNVVINAEQVGRGKPYPEIFLEAMSRADVKPNESVYIGDQYETDIRGSRDVGMIPVLIDRDINYPDYNSSPRIETMYGISELLKIWQSG